MVCIVVMKSHRPKLRSCWGGAAIAAAVTRVSRVSNLKIRFLVFVALLCVFLSLSEPVNSSSEKFKAFLGPWIDENAKNGLFLCFELSRQLSSALRRLKAKSTKIFANRCVLKVKLFSSKASANRARYRRSKRHDSESNVRLINRLCYVGLFAASVSIKSLILVLLMIGGIEQNPGPFPAVGNREGSPLESFNILTQNCRGLTDRNKLIKLLRKMYPRSKVIGSQTIACLQEIHRIDRFAVTNCFDGSCVIDDGERNQKGVCILVPEFLEIVNSVVSGVGRWAIATIQPKAQLSPHKLIIATVYAPNCHRESINFYQDLFHSLDDVISDLTISNETFEVVICGDFNVVLDPRTGSVNRVSSNLEKDLARLITESMSIRSLSEPTQLKQHQSYTWRRGDCFSKLDYVFASKALIPMVVSTAVRWHEFGANFDHAAVRVEFQSRDKPARGRSFPKLFHSDVRSDKDKNWLSEQLTQCQEQIPDFWDPHQKLEFLKTMLRSKTLELRQMRKFEDSSSAIRSKINELVINSPVTRDQAIELEQLRLKLSGAEEIEAEALKVAAGVKWREEGEKSTAYFLARFKARTAATMMYSINLGARVVSGSREVLSVVMQFYTRLYNSLVPDKLSDQAFCDDFFANCPVLDVEQCRIMAKPLDLIELGEALKSCKDSAPGLDGIPYSYYSAFPVLLEYVLDSWNHALTSGNLTVSHRQSCITLLPKKDKDLSQIGNWRPISLSACDLKIVTKAYANRLKMVMPNIICEAQAAYIPGRDISFNNRLLQFAKLYSRKQSLDFCIVSLDARKAFDSVDHKYLEKVLQAYGFPQEFIVVFRTLYSNLTSVVQVNGFLSTEFEVRNGVKQGDALSCGLFNLAIDPLLRNIQQNIDIEGLLIPTSQREFVEVKTLSYADDVTIVCRNGDLQPIFDEYHRLSVLSGLVLNADKTEVFNFIQSPNIRSRVTYMGRIFELGRIDKIRACGIYLATDTEVEYQENIISRIKIMESMILGWGRRQISLSGRMVLAKTYLLSQIVFPAQVVSIRKKEVKRIEKLLYSFVNGARNLYGPERIARSNLKASKENGGINGIDVECFIQSIVVRNFCKAASLHRALGDLQLSLTASIDDISVGAKSILRNNCRKFAEGFAMPDLNEIEIISGSPLSILLTPNSRAAEAAVAESIDSLSSLQLAYNARRGALRGLSVIMRAIPKQIATLIRAGLLVRAPIAVTWMSTSGITRGDKLSSSCLRKALMEEKYPSLEVRLEKIYKRADWPPPPLANFGDLFRNLWRIKHPSLRGIRLKLIYKDIFSNERRFRFKIINSPACDICGLSESVEHHLFECRNATRIWTLFHRMTERRIESLFDVVNCSNNLETEIIKSCLIKSLIQIDRCHNTSDSSLIAECAYYMGIEARANKKDAIRLLNRANLLTALI